MTPESTYQAAKAIATVIAEHFSHHHNGAKMRDENIIVQPPTAGQIEAIIDVAFWASLRREEGYTTKISLAFIPPDLAEQPLYFEHRLPLTAAVLTKLSPGIERPGIHLGVWHDDGELYIWGAMHGIKSICLVLDVSEPGLLVIKHRRIEGFGKFVNVAVLKGDQVKIIDENNASLPDCPAFLTSLLGFTSPSSWNDSVNVLVQLAVSMRGHGHGGSLLVVPSENDEWHNSVVHPITYPVKPAFTSLSELVQQNKSNEIKNWQSALRREVDSLAGLTAIDGATVINDKYELLAFGAKITRAKGNDAVDQVVITEPVIGASATVMHPTQYGGTRHLSAAQFIHDQRNAIALVASQDGRFTIFSWSPCDAMVHAYRVDTLLL